MISDRFKIVKAVAAFILILGFRQAPAKAFIRLFSERGEEMVGVVEERISSGGRNSSNFIYYYVDGNYMAFKFNQYVELSYANDFTLRFYSAELPWSKNKEIIPIAFFSVRSALLLVVECIVFAVLLGVVLYIPTSRER